MREPGSRDEGVPHLRLHEDVNVVVGSAGRTGVGGTRDSPAELIAGARQWFPSALVVAHADAAKVGYGLLHGYFDKLSVARGVTLLQRSENADDHMHAGARITDGRPVEGRRPVLKAGDGHGAAHSLGDGFECLVMAMRPGAAETLDGGVDEAWIDRLQFFIAKAHAVQGAGGEVLQQHVGLGRQLLEQPLAIMVLRLRVRLRLFALNMQKNSSSAFCALATSPLPGVSSLMTSAPSQASICARRSGLVVGHVDDTDSVGRGAWAGP